jgi:hypothetical protein
MPRVTAWCGSDWNDRDLSSGQAEGMQQWLETNGGHLRGMLFGPSPTLGAGHGAVASKAASRGDELAAVPDQCVINLGNVNLIHQSDFNPELCGSSCWQQSQLLVRALAREINADCESHFHLYLSERITPAINAIISFHAAQSNTVSDCLAHGCEFGRALLSDDEHCLPARTEHAYRELAPENGSLSLSQWRRATVAVATRSFALGDDGGVQAMVPAFDDLNSSRFASNVMFAHNPHRGCLLLLAAQPLQAGDELLNDFAGADNSSLRTCRGAFLRRFAFLDPKAQAMSSLQLQHLLIAIRAAHDCSLADNCYKEAIELLGGEQASHPVYYNGTISKTFLDAISALKRSRATYSSLSKDILQKALSVRRSQLRACLAELREEIVNRSTNRAINEIQLLESVRECVQEEQQCIDSALRQS